MTETVPVPLTSTSVKHIPEVIQNAGPSATFAWDEFFSGMVRNTHTKAAYLRAVTQFLAWLEQEKRSLIQVTPGMIGNYLDGLAISASSRKVDLAALRSFFNVLTMRHVVVLNPALSVKGDRVQALEGLTPEITPPQARLLLKSIDVMTLIGFGTAR